MRRHDGRRRVSAARIGLLIGLSIGLTACEAGDEIPRADGGPCVTEAGPCLDAARPLDESVEPDPDDGVPPPDRDLPDGPPPDMGPPPGALGGRCRAEAPACDDALLCLDGRCADPPARGGLGEPCRADEPRCDPALACVEDVCQADPLCPDPCVYGATECSFDSAGYRVCGGTFDGRCTAFGSDRATPVTVACDPGRVCRGGACETVVTGAHAVTEVALLIDRGAIPAAQWPTWSDTVLTWIGEVQPAILVGGRTFPGAEECTDGPDTPRALDPREALRAVFATPAPPGQSRPLYQTMRTITRLVGDATEGRVIVLLTAGGDTCDPPAELLRHVRYLRGRGFKLRVIHLDLANRGPDPTLDALAVAGGLRPQGEAGATRVATPEALHAALTRFGERLDAACADSDRDGYGPFCGTAVDCQPADPAAYPDAAERCNDRDDDCDHAIDEAIADEPATLGDGVCAGRVRTCEDGAWIEPDPAMIPTYEARAETRCDRLDNDCDGRTDEALGDRDGACRLGVGACARDGVWRCDPARPATSLCDATPGMPVPERCDRLDNDCDGRTDEGAPNEGTERCDGRDDDCDARIDEDAVLDDCPGVDLGETPLACHAARCIVGCAPDTRDRDGVPGCEAPAWGGFALGDGFTCVIDREADGAECYGRDAPAIPFDPTIAVAAGGRHACAIRRDAPGDLAGTITCDGPDPTLAAGTAARYTAIGVGDRIACGLTPAGTVQCWGPDPASAGEFEARGGVEEIAVGGRHVCARDAEGFTRCHGHCAAGCNGQGVVPAGALFRQITAGLAHTCGILASDGSIRCWGAGSEICNLPVCGENRGQSIPPAGTGWRAIAAGALHTCAIAADFTLRCWGDSADGRLNAPAGQFTALRAGAAHTCGRRIDGRIRCWGRNDDGSTQPLD
ncbi:MAG: hypothetical protein H6705_14310 [Myxococcales bacterium]|nr:hypothetical protein [Myxococcales bacterium]